jgi:hypothetical protein
MMNQLPTVLQKEIWEYVRGDRAYWKQQFDEIVTVIGWHFVRISRPIKGFTVRLSCEDDYFLIDIFDNDDDFFQVLGKKNDQKLAIREFEVWTKIVHREFGRIDIVRTETGLIDLEVRKALYRAKDEWQARSDSR